MPGVLYVLYYTYSYMQTNVIADKCNSSRYKENEMIKKYEMKTAMTRDYLTEVYP